MNIVERIAAFEGFFSNLQATNSRNDKEYLVKMFRKHLPELNDDLTYIFETLDGRHPIGWTFRAARCPSGKSWTSIKEMIQFCERIPNRTAVATSIAETELGMFGAFLEPIVNRTLRLGIGKSQLAKSDVTPMLAKKYQGTILRTDVVVTEKLDGNRCIARYNPVDERWEFYSRSGKPMKVDFDMTGMNTDLIYDGEVMSETQTALSEKRYLSIVNDTDFKETNDTQKSQLLFNETSGMINRKGQKSGLIYNVFDIVSPLRYIDRRTYLEECDFGHSKDIRLLPVLYAGTDTDYISRLLDRVTQMGGEGVMLNLYDRAYDQKRSDALLKYKQVQHMDMYVVNTYEGTGKYAGLVGGLNCTMITEDGKVINCYVGSGLSDAQREEWAFNPDEIIGKIVQIGYHELTQNANEIGSNRYSLRFPRLIAVRRDKNTTSEF